MTLREDVAKAVRDADISGKNRPLDVADAVLSVVRDRLLSDQTVEAATEGYAYASGPRKTIASDILAAAWAAIDSAGAEPT